MDNLSIRRVPLDALHLDPANARSHPAENLEAIEASLRRFGQAEPLVVHKPSGRVIGGNGRLSAMKKLGWTHADVVELDVDDLTATALGIALNRTADLATWDEPALGKLLAQLRAEGALEGIGYDEDEVDKLLAELQEDLPSELEDPGPEEPPEKPISRPGDLWALGEHRLLCGDSTKDLQRLMDGKQADLVWTDPPYGVSYEGGTEDRLRIQNDDLGLDAQRAFLRSAFRGALEVCRPGACWYVAAPAGPALLPFAEVLAELGIWRQGLVWVKDSLVLGHSDYHYRHEVLFYGWKEGPHLSPPSRDQDTVWEVARPKASPDHPTTKPLELVTRALETSSKRGELILDPFVGSGTTIVAAESSGRVCRAVELDPRYCDVAIRRWEKATGKQATLDGRTFEEVQEERT